MGGDVQSSATWPFVILWVRWHVYLDYLRGHSGPQASCPPGSEVSEAGKHAENT